MNEQDIPKILDKFDRELPHFPDGRIDYTDSDIAAIVKAVVRYKDEMLILKRSEKVLSYRGKWNTVAGYFDELVPIGEKILEELNEETGISRKDILKIEVGEPYEIFDEDGGKTWLVHPALVELKRKPGIKLDWEHTEHRWIRPGEFGNYDMVPTLKEHLFTF